MIELNEEDKKFLYKHRKMIEQENFDGLFGFKNRLRDIDKLSIPQDYTQIINYFYSDLGVNILDYMTQIPRLLFYNVSVDTIIIPEHLKEINDFAFYDCRCKNIIIKDGVVNIGEWAFSGCSKIKKLTIPESVKSIGEAAFSGCSELKEVYAPYIDGWNYSIFDECTSLEKLTLSKKLEPYCSQETFDLMGIDGNKTEISFI